MIIIAYHDKCMDGLAAAWVAWRRAKDTGYEGAIKLVPMQYNDDSYAALLEETTIVAGDSMYHTTVYVVDFSIPIVWLQRMTSNCLTQVVIYDHHKTAFEVYEDHLSGLAISVRAGDKYSGRVAGRLDALSCHVVLDSSVCGSVVTWQELHRTDYESPMPTILHYINDRDLWKFNFPETKAVHMYLLSQLEYKSGREAVELFDVIADKFQQVKLRDKMVRQGLELLEAWEKQVKAYAATADYILVAGTEVLTTKEVPGKYASDVGNTLAKQSKTSIGCTYFTDPDTGVVKYSLRSIGDVDMSTLAKAHGGGGHKNAAGFEVKLKRGRSL